MKKLILIFLAISSTLSFAARIDPDNNQQARKLLMNLELVQNQISRIESISNNSVQLEMITASDVGIREDLRVDERYNSGVKHKFVYLDETGDLECNFSIYVVYQHTAPLSLNRSLTRLTKPAKCTQY